jgi:hypothetical protein
MNNLHPATLMMPVIAFILVFVFYFSLRNKEPDKKALKRFIYNVTVLAFLLNFFWEILQMPMYKAGDYNFQGIAFCTLATVVDAIMVILLYLCFSLIYSESMWVRHLRFFRVVSVMLIGATGAIVIEIMYLSSGSWAYDQSMPIIPVLNVGLSPVLQFTVLPVIIYYLSFQILKYSDKQRKISGYH